MSKAGVELGSSKSNSRSKSYQKPYLGCLKARHFNVETK